MFIASSKRTMAGARILAAQRQTRTQVRSAIILRLKPPVRMASQIRVPSRDEVARARALTYLAGLKIETRSSCRAIIDNIAAWHGMTAEDIFGKDSRAPVVACRFDAIVAVKQAHPTISMSALGRIFHHDRTTVRSALKRRGVR